MLNRKSPTCGCATSTLGGNLAFSDPHSDPGTVLLIHRASVALGSRRGERKLALRNFFVDMYATALEPDELLLEVEVPFLPPRNALINGCIAISGRRWELLPACA